MAPTKANVPFGAVPPSIEALKRSAEQAPRLAFGLLRGHVLRLSFHPEGCRVVQSVMDAVNNDEKAQLVEELHGYVLEAMKSHHANFVISNFAEKCPSASEAMNFIYSEVKDNAAKVAKDRFGCRLLSKIFMHCLEEDKRTAALLEELLEDLRALCKHAYGHFVIDAVLEHGPRRQRERIAEELLKGAVDYGKNRHASHLIEKVLKTGMEIGLGDQRRRLRAVLTENREKLDGNQYGAFVIKTLKTAMVSDDAGVVHD